MKYKTGDEIYDISRDRIGVVLSVGEDTYELALDGYDLPLFASENSLILLDDIGRLQAENERLKAALEKLFTVSFYYSNGIECKRCAQRAATPQAVVHLSWCEVGEAKDMLKNEVIP